MLSGGLSLKVSAFMSRKLLEVWEEIRSFRISQTVLLCRLMRRAWICCWQQLRRMCF
jgi:hypothetical protein